MRYSFTINNGYVDITQCVTIKLIKALYPLNGRVF